MASLQLVLSVGLRNLGRNRRRTAIAGIGIALGVAMSIVSFGVMDGMSNDMVHSITDAQLGHVQVRAPELSSPAKLEQAFEHASELLRAVDITPGVEAAAPRLTTWTLVAGEHDSAGMQLLGIDPAREAALTHLDRHVERGHYLPQAATPWPAARALSASEQALDRELTERQTAAAAAEIAALGDPTSPLPVAPSTPDAETRRLLSEVEPGPEAPPPLLLGKKLARKLRAQPGTLLDASGTDRQGNPVSVRFRVVGIAATGDAALDQVRGYTNLADLQRWLGVAGRAHELSLRLAHPDRAPEVARRLAAQASLRGLEVKTWQELRPDVVAMLATNHTFTALMVAIIFAVAGIGVADTVLMAVFERRRELGVLKAIGMHPASIVLMIVAETLFLGAAAATAGLGLGVGLDLLLGRYGIPLGALSGFSLAGAAVPPVLHATLTAQGALLPVALILLMALLAATWPALVAARTEPALAMKDR